MYKVSRAPRYACVFIYVNIFFYRLPSSGFILIVTLLPSAEANFSTVLWGSLLGSGFVVSFSGIAVFSGIDLAVV